MSFNGNSYGIGIEGSASVGRGKENGETQVWQNNQLQAGKVQINTENKLTLDASQLKANGLEANVGALEIISRQDVSKYHSKQVQVGGSFSVTYGSGGGASFNASYSSAKLNAAQVEHQSGIEVGQGGMDINVQGNTHLEGAIIASQVDSQHNRFETGTLTTKDIANYSELKTRSASISGGTGGINPMSALSLLGNKNESEHTTTKSAIDSNINIHLTQDPNAQSTLQSLNRDTKNANQKVTQYDLNEIKETQELVKGIGEIADKAMQIYTHNEREKLEQAKLELGRANAQNASEKEITELNNKLNDLQKAYDKEYGTGSPTKQAVDAITAALQGLAAKDGRQALVGLVSPYLNEQIKKYTGDNKQANLIAHALLGVVEAQITGNNALAGAVAGAGSEAAAMVIKNNLYSDKPTDQLSESEKQTITFLSQLAGGLAAGVVGDSTVSAAIGVDIGKRAVENNFFDVVVRNPQVDWLGMAEGEKIKQTVDEEISEAIAEEIKDTLDKYAPHYISAGAQVYGIGGEVAINLRNGDILAGGTFSPLTLPSRVGLSIGVNLGWITNLDDKERKDSFGYRITGNVISSAIKGSSAGISVCYGIYCGSYSTSISSEPSNKNYRTFEIGIGEGGTGGNISEEFMKGIDK